MDSKTEIEKRINNIRIIRVFVDTGLIVVIFCLLYLGFLLFYKQDNHNQVQYPTGGLSQSIYEYQNNEYESQTDMKNIHFIFNGHYAYDMYDTQLAKIGDSFFYKISNGVNVGVTSIKNGGYLEQKPIDVLKRDIKSGFDITNIEEKKKEEGYRNGWDATFYIFSGTNSSGEQCNCVAYVVKVEEGYFIVSSFSTTEDYEPAMAQCNKVYLTMRVSSEWMQKNETQTSEMFIPETEETQSEEISSYNEN